MKETLQSASDLTSTAIVYQMPSSFKSTQKRESAVSTRGVLSFASTVVTGLLTGFTAAGAPLVNFKGNETDGSLAARSTVLIDRTQVGCEIVLLFENSDIAKPIIVGIVQSPAKSAAEERPSITLDGEQLVFTAEKEIVLRCGKSSIILTRAGKVLIQGEYVSTRASAVNRIKGGSVQIN